MSIAYCFGHISTGMLYRLKKGFPQKDGYGEIVSGERNYCGEALSSAVVLKRLGVDVMLEGNWLGDNEVGRGTHNFICNEGIDAGSVLIKPGYSGVEEIVFCDSESRTVFGRYERLLFTSRQWEMPTVEKVAKAHVACADPSFGEASELVAQVANKNNVPFVAIDAPLDSVLTKSAEVVVISNEFLMRAYREKVPTGSLGDLFEKYIDTCSGLVVFTFGAEELWYGRTERHTMQPLTVRAVLDTAGAGDSFRAAIMYAVIAGMNDEEMLRFGCAVAAEVVQTGPGVLGFRGVGLLP